MGLEDPMKVWGRLYVRAGCSIGEHPVLEAVLCLQYRL